MNLIHIPNQANQEENTTDPLVIALPVVAVVAIGAISTVVFIKRKRDKKRIDLREDGKGDERIRQVADVYRAPASAKRRLH